MWNLMLFWWFWPHLAKMDPKVSINDRFYKVFWYAFLDASKCSRTNDFLTFCKVVKRYQLLLKNLILFYTFRSRFAKRAPKVSINDRFYKVFLWTFLDAPKCSRTNAFSTFREVVKRHQLLVENLMLLWYFWEPFREYEPESLHKQQDL